MANNVFAHVPDIVDFARGLRALVSDTGFVSIEIPHLLRLVESREYDTIYHEHFSYLSLLTTQRVLAKAGLTCGGRRGAAARTVDHCELGRPQTESAGPPSARVAKVLADEEAAGLHDLRGHEGFGSAVAEIRNDLVEFLIDCSRKGATVAGYGAPGKGNTLLNHCGVRSDLLEYTVDRNPFKHGKFLPGTHIPIHPVEHLAETKPDYIVIMPWNLRRRDCRATCVHPRMGCPARRRFARARSLLRRWKSHEGRIVLRRTRASDADKRGTRSPNR